MDRKIPFSAPPYHTVYKSAQAEHFSPLGPVDRLLILYPKSDLGMQHGLPLIIDRLHCLVVIIYDGYTCALMQISIRKLPVRQCPRANILVVQLIFSMYDTISS